MKLDIGCIFLSAAMLILGTGCCLMRFVESSKPRPYPPRSHFIPASQPAKRQPPRDAYRFFDSPAWEDDA